jgi:hypothetical protein
MFVVLDGRLAGKKAVVLRQKYINNKPSWLFKYLPFKKHVYASTTVTIVAILGKVSHWKTLMPLSLIKFCKLPF